MMNTQFTVESLRKSGFKVRVMHNRWVQTSEMAGRWVLMNPKQIQPGDVLDPKGGFTVVEVTDPNGNNFTGEAKCNDVDSYNRRMGISIALGRALKTANVSV